MSKIAESKLGEDALRSRLEDAKRDLVNKDLDNKSLRMQVGAQFAQYRSRDLDVVFRLKR